MAYDITVDHLFLVRKKRHNPVFLVASSSLASSSLAELMHILRYIAIHISTLGAVRAQYQRIKSAIFVFGGLTRSTDAPR